MEHIDLLDETRKALRITNNVFDGEIEILINACKKDLSLAGVVSIDESDPLIIRAIMLYAKTNFGLGDENGRYQRLYNSLKLSLRESGDYNV